MGEIQHSLMFRFHSVVVFLLCSLCFSQVYLHVNLPSVLYKEISSSFNIKVDSLSAFSSAFFISYGILQLFSGYLLEKTKNCIVLGFSSLVASYGAFICYSTKKHWVAVLGRVITAIGCSSIYIPIPRLFSKWFSHDSSSLIFVLFYSIGFSGGFIAQIPLISYSNYTTWRNSYHKLSIIGILIGFLIIFFVRDSPKDFGYEDQIDIVEKDITGLKNHEETKSEMRNFYFVCANRNIILLSINIFITNGIFYNIVGLWGGPFIRDSSKYNEGYMLCSLSLSLIIGFISLPIICSFLGSFKWMLIILNLISLIIEIVLIFLDSSFSFFILFCLFFIFGISVGSASNSLTSHIGENFVTSFQWISFLSLFGGGILQILTGVLFKKHGVIGKPYEHECYQKYLWLPSVLLNILALIPLILIKDNIGNCVIDSSENELKQNS